MIEDNLSIVNNSKQIETNDDSKKIEKKGRKKPILWRKRESLKKWEMPILI